jgi:ascorbate-specific PTS system EIIC-type component UlaA
MFYPTLREVAFAQGVMVLLVFAYMGMHYIFISGRLVLWRSFVVLTIAFLIALFRLEEDEFSDVVRTIGLAFLLIAFALGMFVLQLRGSGFVPLPPSPPVYAPPPAALRRRSTFSQAA